MKKIGKILILIIIAGLTMLPLSACSSSSGDNLFSNENFLSRDIESRFADDWIFYSPDMNLVRIYTLSELADVSEQGAHYKFRIENGNSYAYLAQKVKVSPNTSYCFTFSIKIPDYSQDKNSKKNLGVYPTILEDEAILLSPDYQTAALNARTLASLYSFHTFNFFFNTNGLSEVTVALWMGGDGALCAGSLAVKDLKLVKRRTIQSSTYTVLPNSGYNVTTARETAFIVTTSVLSAVVFVGLVLMLSLASVSSKRVKPAKAAAPKEINIPEDDDTSDNMNVGESAQAGGIDFQNLDDEVRKAARKLLDDDAVDVDDPVQPDEGEGIAGEGAVFDSDAENDTIDTVPIKVHKQSELVLKLKRFFGTTLAEFFQKPVVLLGIVIAVAFVLRLTLALTVRGFREDIDIILGYIESINSKGLSQFYTQNTTNYSPGGAYLLAVIGFLMRGFNVNPLSADAQLLVKLPAIICDCITIGVVFVVAKRLANSMFALVASAMLAFNPAIIMNSAGWGQSDSVYTLFLVLSLYALLNKKMLVSVAMFTLAALFRVNTWGIAPIYAFYLTILMFKALSQIIKDKKSGKIIRLNSPVYYNAWRIPVYVLGAMVLFYLLALPVAKSAVEENFFFPFSRLIFGAATDYILFSDNMFNFFALLGRNGYELGDSFPTMIFAVAFFIIIMLIAAMIYLSRQNRANLVLLCAYAYFALVMFLVDIRPTYLVSSIVLLLLAVIVNRDRRLLFIYGALSLLCFANQAIAMAFANNLNNLPAYLLNPEINTAFDGVRFIADSNGALAINIIFSILFLALFVYFTYIVLEIGLASRRKKILPLEINSRKDFLPALGKSLKSMFK